jgi:hypothetical protein
MFKGCIIKHMILIKTEPFTREDIEKAKERYEVYIKTVIDIRKEICAAGSDMHADSEKLLLEKDSSQNDLWGGGINLETHEIDFNSFINIRPTQENTSIEIQNPQVRETFMRLMKRFFAVVYEQ